MRHLVLVTLYGCLSGMQGGMKHANQTYRVTSTKCRIDTVVSSDDGLVVARNKRTKSNCAPSSLYLQA